jgi:predicted dinucleotide-binding enzyme
MKIGILGSGNVGRSLGAALAGKKHQVKIGSRNPRKPDLRKWLASTRGKVSTGSFPECAAFGELLILCSDGDAVLKVLKLAGPANFSGKIVIDVTNPLDFSRGEAPGIFVGTTDSLGERVQRKLKSAKVVKCFNIVNHRTMVAPRTGGEMPTMMIAGNDVGAKKKVAVLLRLLGWTDIIDVGGIEGARWLEALVPLWVRVAIQLRNWRVAFKVLR